MHRYCTPKYQNNSNTNQFSDSHDNYELREIIIYFMKQ